MLGVSPFSIRTSSAGAVYFGGLHRVASAYENDPELDMAQDYLELVETCLDQANRGWALKGRYPKGIAPHQLFAIQTPNEDDLRFQTMVRNKTDIARVLDLYFPQPQSQQAQWIATA